MNLNFFGKYSPDYLKAIRENLVNNADGNGGRKDGRITLRESYNSLDVGSLFSGLEKGSFEYNRLGHYASKIPAALQKYAGDDGTFTVEEYTALKNNKVYKNFLDQYNVSPFSFE